MDLGGYPKTCGMQERAHRKDFERLYAALQALVAD